MEEENKNNYKKEFLENWTKAGGLITKVTASRIFEVDKSVFSKRQLAIYKIGKSEFLSLAQVLQMNIKPRKKRKKRKENQEKKE